MVRYHLGDFQNNASWFTQKVTDDRKQQINAQEGQHDLNDSLDILSAPGVRVGTPVDVQESIHPAHSCTAVKENGGDDEDENEGISNGNGNEVEAKYYVEGHEGKSK